MIYKDRDVWGVARNEDVIPKYDTSRKNGVGYLKVFALHYITVAEEVRKTTIWQHISIRKSVCSRTISVKLASFLRYKYWYSYVCYALLVSGILECFSLA